MKINPNLFFLPYLTNMFKHLLSKKNLQRLLPNTKGNEIGTVAAKRSGIYEEQ